MKVLFFPGPFGLSHTTRLWQIGNYMKRCGWELAVSINPDQEVLQWIDFKTFSCPKFPKLEDGNTNIYELGDEKLIQSYVVAELEAINSFSPDLLIADLRPTARISSKISERKLITIGNSALTREFNPFEHFGLANSKRLYKKNRINVTHHLAHLYKSVADKYNLAGLDDLFDFIQGDYHLICDLESLFPLTYQNPAIEFIPPMFLEKDDLVRKDREEPIINQDKIVVYITIGNTGDTRLIELFVEAFENDQSCQVIISTGLQNEHYKEGYKEPHIFLSPFVDPSCVLPHAQVMIHHGGSGSMYQAMKYNIPSIVLPLNIEQKLNAITIEKTQTGVVMDINNISPQRLLEKTQKVYKSQKLLKEKGEELSIILKQEYDWCSLFKRLMANS